MGRERGTQWEKPRLKDTSKRRNREEHATLVCKEDIRILCLHGILQLTRHRPQHTETSQGSRRPAPYHACPDEETITQK